MARIECGSVIKRVAMFPVSLFRSLQSVEVFAVAIGAAGSRTTDTLRPNGLIVALKCVTCPPLFPASDDDLFGHNDWLEAVPRTGEGTSALRGPRHSRHAGYYSAVPGRTGFLDTGGPARALPPGRRKSQRRRGGRRAGCRRGKGRGGRRGGRVGVHRGVFLAPHPGVLSRGGSIRRDVGPGR